MLIVDILGGILASQETPSVDMRLRRDGVLVHVINLLERQALGLKEAALVGK